MPARALFDAACHGFLMSKLMGLWKHLPLPRAVGCAHVGTVRLTGATLSCHSIGRGSTGTLALGSLVWLTTARSTNIWSWHASPNWPHVPMMLS